MNKAFTVAIVILGLIGLFAIGYYAVFVSVEKAFENAMDSMHKRQQVAENVQITSEWLEIRPETALETTKKVQNIELLIEGYENDIHKNDCGNIQLEDGTYIKPEVEIVDENGKTYQLRDGQRGGNLIGFSPNKKIHGTHSFPKDVTYKTIRIRSDKPFLCKGVYWTDYDLK